MPKPKPRPDRRPPAKTRAGSRITATARVEITGAEAPTAEAPARFSMVAYTGEPMRICSWSDPVVVDLETADLSEQRIPALYDHYADMGSVVGQVETLAIEDKKLVAGGAFTIPPTDPQYGKSCAERVLELARAGYQWQASVGADPATIVEVAAGEVGVANWGREYPGPCVIGRGCKFRELSFVVLGGDRRTSVVTARIKGNAMTFEQWLLAMGFDDAASLTEVQRANLELKFKEEYPDETTTDDTTTTTTEPVTAADGTEEEDEEEEKPVTARDKGPKVKGSRKPNKPTPKRVDPVEEDNRRLAANRERVSAITDIEAEYGPLKIKADGREVDLYAHAIKAGWTRDRTELAAMRESRKAGPHIHVPGNAALAAAAKPAVIECALLRSLGRNVDDEKKYKYKPEVIEAADKHFRGLGLQRVLLMAAAENGYSVSPGERITSSNLRTVLRAAFSGPSVRAAGTSTVSLPGILGNVANKELLAGYMEEDQTWREVAAVKPATNFHTRTYYRMLDNMEYEEVGPDGKIKHGAIDQESYTASLRTFAKMFSLTRRDMINDDLGAFNDLKNRLGRGAAKKFNNVFWTEFLSNASTFWTTARTNYIEGATTNLGTDGVGLGLGVKAFRQMRSPSADGSKRMGGNPDRLVVPPELEQIAEALHVNQNIGTTKTSDTNIYAGKYRPVVVPWLSDSAFTGYSTTAWYLLRPPTDLAAVVVSFLNGMETPTVEDTDADFDTLGVQFRGYHDFDADQAEYLCGVKSKGAA